MTKERSKNIKVGIFVLLGTIFIISALYFIGERQNLFGSKFRIKTYFENVNGLMPGNNVRYGGINVGTVESVEIINDTSVLVVMLIKDKIQPFIKKNVIANIGTDGLMGNKLINLNFATKQAPLIKDGDIIKSKQLLETDEMVKTLSQTNQDVSVVAKNLREITDKLNSANNVWSLLMDPVLAENVKKTIVNFKMTSERSAIITGDLSKLVKEANSGKGLIGALITDTTLTRSFKQTIVNIKFASDTLAYITGDLKNVSQKIKNGEGAVGTLLMDTTFVYNLNKSMENIEKGTGNFNENMEALKHNILLRKYFKKQEKKNNE